MNHYYIVLRKLFLWLATEPIDYLLETQRICLKQASESCLDEFKCSRVGACGLEMLGRIDRDTKENRDIG